MYRIFLIFFFINITEAFSQQYEDDMFQIYKTTINEVKKEYSGKKIYFDNLIINELFYIFDSLEFPDKYRQSFLDIRKDKSMIYYDFKNIDKNIDTVSITNVNDFIYIDSLNSSSKYLVRFTSPIFDNNKTHCIIIIFYWWGWDTTLIYHLYLKKEKNNKWEKIRIEQK
jgi:hypothetical protein